MLKYLKNELNYTHTENGALAYKSTLSYCLDLFALIGSMRKMPEREIILRFSDAFNENPDVAMKILFYARDIRGGLGERRVFRVILRWLCENKPESVIKNADFISEYGRFDDLLVLMETECEKVAVEIIKNQLKEDMNSEGEVSLLAKWMPSVNTSSEEAVRLGKLCAERLEISEAEYRKMLSKLRRRIKIVENNLREADYTFDYAKLPSKALFKYRRAFSCNDRDRYEAFILSAEKNNELLNAKTLMPYEIIAPIVDNAVSDFEKRVMDATWKSLKDYTDDRNAIAVIDGSGSMYSYYNPMPACVALSLGIYFAERNKGAFANHFITFSENPQLVEIKGDNICEKVKYCEKYNEIANTDIQKVFELILNTAVKNHLPQNELPETIYIVSDMEFDCCTEGASITNFEYAKKLYAEYGYELPNVVFWNVSAYPGHHPVRKNEQGAVLVSGCNPSIFEMTAKGELTPEKYMMSVVGSERYAKISA